MSLENSSPFRHCCCNIQPHITVEDVNRLASSPQYQLRNLSATFASELEGKDSYGIREFFLNSHVPFRYQGCVHAGLTCCGTCVKQCSRRCPQDVLNRAFIFCAPILYASDKEEAYECASTWAKYLYKELIAPIPRYMAIEAMVREVIDPKNSSERVPMLNELDKGSHRLDYSPRIETTVTNVIRHGKLLRNVVRYKVNPENGELFIVEWPKSGLCPFCLPASISNRNLKEDSKMKQELYRRKSRS